MALDWLLEIGSNSFTFIGFHNSEISQRPERALCILTGFGRHKEIVKRSNLSLPTNFSNHWCSFHQLHIKLLKLWVFNELWTLITLTLGNFQFKHHCLTATTAVHKKNTGNNREIPDGEQRKHLNTPSNAIKATAKWSFRFHLVNYFLISTRYLKGPKRLYFHSLWGVIYWDSLR